MTHLTHLLRSLCKRKTQMIGRPLREKRESRQGSSDTASVPLAALAHFTTRWSWSSPPAETVSARKRHGLSCAIAPLRFEGDRQPIPIDLHETRRTAGGKLVTETEGVGGELSHGVIDD